jgi:hypothetical protein
MLHKSQLRVQDKADTAEPFLKGEGGVLRDLHTRAEVQYISLHAARPSDELPKKIDAQSDAYH